MLTTMAFDHSRRRRFGTCSCQPVPRGLPSSIKQLHTLGPPRPPALVAHDRRRSGRQSCRPAPLSCARLRPTDRRHSAGRYSQAAAMPLNPAGSLPWSPTIGLVPTLPPSSISGLSQECGGRPLGARRTEGSTRDLFGRKSSECPRRVSSSLASFGFPPSVHP